MPLTGFLGDVRDPHGERVRGIEHEVGFASGEELAQALDRETAGFDLDTRTKRAKQMVAGFRARYGRSDVETGVEERASQKRTLMRPAQ
jgi:hypothetical protein